MGTDISVGTNEVDQILFWYPIDPIRVSFQIASCDPYPDTGNGKASQRNNISGIEAIRFFGELFLIEVSQCSLSPFSFGD